MDRVVLIDGKEVRMRATASTLIRYNNTFPGRDLLTEAQAMQDKPTDPENLGTITRLAYIMAKQADGGKETFLDWLDEFGAFGVVTAAADILAVWIGNQETTVEGKKK